MISLPQKTYLGELKISNIFQFYDFPRLFTCRNRSGAQFLVLSTFDDFNEYEWLYLPISNDKLAAVLDRKITLRNCYETAEDGYLFKVNTNFEGEAEVESIFPEQIPEDDLPIKGIFLETDERVSVGFGSINASEAAITSRRETFNLHLYPSDTILPELEIKSFGAVLTTFQDLVDSLGQYCDGEPTLKGAIPGHILEKTRFKATQIFDGSFGIQLKSNSTCDLFDGSLASDALMELTHLLESGADIDRISNKLHQLKGRVAMKYRSFLKVLTKIDTPLKIDWGSPNEERGTTLTIDKKTLSKTFEAVSQIDTDMSETIMFKAELLGLNVKTKRYCVHHLSDNEDYSGKIAEESLHLIGHKEINGIYNVTLKRLIETNSASGAEQIKWLLISLKSTQEKS